MKEFLYVLLIGFILGSVTTYFVKPGEEVERIDSVTVAVDTNKIINEYYAEMKAKLRAELKPSVIKIKEKVNIDSLWKEAKQYAIDSLYAINGDYLYIASADTTLEDSTSSMSAHVDVISPIPIHKTTKIKFELKNEIWSLDSVKTEYKTIMEEIAFHEDLWFWFAMLESLMIVIISIL